MYQYSLMITRSIVRKNTFKNGAFQWLLNKGRGTTSDREVTATGILSSGILSDDLDLATPALEVSCQGQVICAILLYIVKGSHLCCLDLLIIEIPEVHRR